MSITWLGSLLLRKATDTITQFNHGINKQVSKLVSKAQKLYFMRRKVQNHVLPAFQSVQIIGGICEHNKTKAQS